MKLQIISLVISIIALVFDYSESCQLKVMGRKGWCKDGTYKNRMQNTS